MCSTIKPCGLKDGSTVKFDRAKIVFMFTLFADSKRFQGNELLTADVPYWFSFTGVIVHHTISQLTRFQVNSSDEGGVLTGNWSGDYSGGTSPLKWTGSAAILEQYLENEAPVRFGQCWVFSGVLTAGEEWLGLGVWCFSVFTRGCKRAWYCYTLMLLHQCWFYRKQAWELAADPRISVQKKKEKKSAPKNKTVRSN